MKSFWLELKSICKSFKFIAFIIVLLAFQIMLITQFQSEAALVEIGELRGNERYSSENNSWVIFWEKEYEELGLHGESFWNFTFEIIEYDLKWYQYEKKLAHNISEAYANDDWATYNRYMAEKRLVDLNLYWMIMDNNNRYIPPVITAEEYFDEAWSFYKTLVDTPEFYRPPIWAGERIKIALPPPRALLSAAYHLHLLKVDLPPMGPHDISPWGFLFNFMRRGLPNILGLLVLLMTVNLLHRDKKSGSIKTALQLPKSRSYYLLRKLALGYLSSLFVILIPHLLMFVGLGIKNGFRGLRFPVIIDNGFFNWSVAEDHLIYALENTPFYQFGLSQYQLPWNVYLSGLERLDIIALWQFLSLAFISLALFILFCSVLGILISIVVKNEVLAQGIAVGVFALGTAFGSIFPRLNTSSWDFFAKADIIPLLEGSHYSTYLSSLVTISIATILLFGLSAIVFRKQDIISS